MSFSGTGCSGDCYRWDWVSRSVAGNIGVTEIVNPADDRSPTAIKNRDADAVV